MNEKSVRFKCMNKVIVLALVMTAPGLFEKIASSKWCREYVGMSCEIMHNEKKIYIIFCCATFKSTHVIMKIPDKMNIRKKLVDKKFCIEIVEEDENDVYYYDFPRFRVKPGDAATLTNSEISYGDVDISS